MHSPVAFVGFSGSGKTTILTKLVRHFAARGDLVAVIKHTHHDLRERSSSGDSERFLAAGATTVVLASGREALILPEETIIAYDDLSELIESIKAKRLFIEGFKSRRISPRIVVHRSGVESADLSDAAAVISDAPVETVLPTFRHDDLDAIATFVDRISRR